MEIRLVEFDLFDEVSLLVLFDDVVLLVVASLMAIPEQLCTMELVRHSRVELLDVGHVLTQVVLKRVDIVGATK